MTTIVSMDRKYIELHALEYAYMHLASTDYDKPIRFAFDALAKKYTAISFEDYKRWADAHEWFD